MKYGRERKGFEPGINKDDQYVEGFEVVGDVSRKRKKELEVGGDFKPNNDKETWEKMFKNPGSIHNFTTERILTEHSSGKWYPMTFKSFSTGKIKLPS